METNINHLNKKGLRKYAKTLALENQELNKEIENLNRRLSLVIHDRTNKATPASKAN